MVEICRKNGLVLSPTKMKIATQEIEFLGVIIGKQRIRLQPHIIKKVIEFDEEKLKTKSGLRSFLGILNYARNHIPKLGTLLGPLYEKTGVHGDKRLKPSDYELIQEIKEKVSKLPDLEIPPENAYIILETDGCMEGWGGVCKWKRRKGDPVSEEKICAYASGRFKTVQSTIDAEIYGCINVLEKLKIYYLDQKEITLRTDCQAIISFYNKTNSNKASRVRWMKFADAITGTGVQVNIEHIEGKRNVLADALSRLIKLCLAKEEKDQTANILSVTLTLEEIFVAGTIQEAQKVTKYLGTPSFEEHIEEESAYPLTPRFTIEEAMPLDPPRIEEKTLAQFKKAHNQERECKARWYEGDLRNQDGRWDWYGTRHGASFSTIRREESSPAIQAQGKKIIEEAKESIRPKNRPKSPLDHKMKGLAINCLVEQNSKPNYKHHPVHGIILEDDASDDKKEEDTCESYVLEDEGWDDSTLVKIDPPIIRANIRGARYSRL